MEHPLRNNPFLILMLGSLLLYSGCRESTVLSLAQIAGPAPLATLAVTHDVVGTSNGANTVVATFSRRVLDLSPSNANGEFTASGCATEPSVAIVMSVIGGRSVATATLSGGICADADTVTVELHLNRVTDTGGNLGSAGANPVATYTIDTDPATAILAAPVYPGSQDAVKNGDAAVTHVLNFTNAATQTLTASTGTTASPPAGLTVSTTGTAVACDVEMITPTLAGATLSISNCTGDGAVLVEANAGIATSAGNLPNTVSSQQVVLVENTPPTVVLSGIAPTGGAGGSNTITATFSSLINPVTSGAVVITGCTTPPSVTSVTMSDDGNGHSIATLHIGGGVTCVSAQHITVQFHLENTTDLANNAGLASQNPGLEQYLIP